MIDLSKFKVVYKEKVLRAVSVMDFSLSEKCFDETGRVTGIGKLKFLTIMALNEDGNLITIHDEAWCFQFIPVVNGGS